MKCCFNSSQIFSFIYGRYRFFQVKLFYASPWGGGSGLLSYNHSASSCLPDFEMEGVRVGLRVVGSRLQEEPVLELAFNTIEHNRKTHSNVCC
jgi:hypothetical protein